MEEISLEILSEPSEHQIIRKLADFPSTVLFSAEEREAHRIPHYLLRISWFISSLL